MLHTTRVSAWVPILGTWAEMLMSAMAAILYYGVLHDDPNTGALAGLAALGTGSVALIILTGLWMGITVNVANCPAMHQQPAARHYPDLNTLNADTVSIFQAQDGTNWHMHFSRKHIKALSLLLQRGIDTLPFEDCRRAGFTRGEWSLLKCELTRAEMAVKVRSGSGWGIRVTDDGRRAIYKFAADHPLPQEVDGY